jgi:hypothetical protein
MQPTDLTIEILKGIRDETRQTNVRLDELRVDLTGRIDSTNERLERVERRQVESEPCARCGTCSSRIARCAVRWRTTSDGSSRSRPSRARARRQSLPASTAPVPSHCAGHLLPRHDAHARPALEHPPERLQLPGLPPGPHAQLNSVLEHEPFRPDT